MNTTQTQNSQDDLSPLPSRNERIKTPSTLEYFDAAISTFAAKAGRIDDSAPAVLRIPGLIVLISGTQGGKTTLLKSLCQEFDGMFVELQEPSANSLRSIAELPERIEQIFSVKPNCTFLAVDSLRVMQFEAPGNARKGGISSGFYRLLTDLTICALRANVTIVCTLNPLSNDNLDALDNAMSDVESSVTSVITGSSSSWQYISRDLGRRVYSPFGYDIKELDDSFVTPVELKLTEFVPSQVGDVITRLTTPRHHAVPIDDFDSITSESNLSDKLDALESLTMGQLDDDLNAFN